VERPACTKVLTGIFVDTSTHTLETLFRQLGLPCEPADIDRFVLAHRPLPGMLALHEAPFWTTAQAEFLCGAVVDDADWAEVVDQFDALLR